MARLVFTCLVLNLFCLPFAWCESIEQADLKPSMKVAMPINVKVSNAVKDHILYAYNLLGYKVDFYPIVTGRSIKLTEIGELDAEAVRISIIETSVKNLLRVPTLLGRGTLELYCLPNIVCDTSVLEQKDNLIGVISGTNITSAYMKNKGASVYHIPSNLVLSQLLNLKRLNYILSLSVNNENRNNIVGIDKSKYQVIPLKQFEAFHYVHKKHKSLVPYLASSLEQAISALGKIEMKFD